MIQRAYIGIELADEAGEIVVLEVSREEAGSEFRMIPDHEARIGGTPGHDVVCGGVVDHFIRLQQKRSRPASATGDSAVHISARGFRRSRLIERGEGDCDG